MNYTDKTNACMICDEVITNPICQDCLDQEMVSWINDYDKELINQVTITSKVFSKSNLTDVKCALCNNLMDVCAHCYSKEVLRSIYRKDEKLAQKFIRTFNFDLI